ILVETAAAACSVPEDREQGPGRQADQSTKELRIRSVYPSSGRSNESTPILLEAGSLREVGRALNMPATKPAGKLQPVSAVILAAGTSSRMGEAKQLLTLGKSTVLARTLALAQ